MQARPSSKYHLKDLYQEIAFYDRKIAYCQNLEKFDSAEERSRAVEKLAKKRKTLVLSAATMANSGIEYDPSQLPASLKNADFLALLPKTPAAVTPINKVASSA
jgi:hypothetical protein